MIYNNKKYYIHYLVRYEIIFLIALWCCIFFNSRISASSQDHLKLGVPQLTHPIDNIIYSETPTFRWASIDSANGYTIYIKQGEKTIFNSSLFAIIDKIEFEIPDNILFFGGNYSFQLKAYNKEQWSEFSEPFNFSVQEKQELIKLSPPEVISKRGIVADTMNGNVYNKIFWYNLKDAISYEILIDGINSSSIFGDEFTNLVSETLIDSNFVLDKNLFINYDKYRWKIRSRNNNSKSRYSPYYYFTLNEETVYPQESTIEEIVLRIKYAGFIDEMIIAKYKNGKVLLPIVEILSILKLNHKYDFENKILYGKRQDDEGLKYLLNIDKREYTLGDESTIISSEDIIKSDLDNFVDKTIVEKITGMSTKVDMRNLAINLSSDFILPMIQRKLNEKKLSLNRSNNAERNYPLLFNRQRKIISGGFLDYSATGNYIQNQAPYYSLNFGLGAELLGGDAQIYSQQSLINNQIQYTQLRYKWRYAFLNNDHISTISLGHNNSNGLLSYSIKGINVSNEPVEARRIYGHYKVKEKTSPHWKVEVYHNNQLIDIVHADQKGKYDFYIPFSYGTTLLELHKIGPNGEYEIENKMYQIPIEQVPEGRLDYIANFGEIANTKEMIFQSKAAYGINNWLTTRIGTDIFTNDLKYSSFYSNTTARLFDGYIANLIIAPNAFHELSINSIFSDLASFSLSAKLHEENIKLNPANIKDEIEGNVFLPIKVNQNMMSLLFRGRQARFANSKRTDLSFRTFYNFRSLSPSIELNYFHQENENNNFSSAYLNFRLNYSMYFPSTIFSGNILDARFGYDLINSKPQSMNISVSTTVLQKFRVQLSHITNFQNSNSETQLRIVFDLPFFRSNTTMSRNVMSQSVIGSVNYNEHSEDFNFYNRGMIGRSAANFKFFVDENMNERYDEGENIIPDMDIQINSVGNKRRKDEGDIIVNDLEQYSKYDVKLIDKKSKNPLWFPYKNKFSFVSDPHQYKEIEVPFYEAAEVNGSVLKRSNNNLVPISGIIVIFKNINTYSVSKIRTMSDGTFYHYGIQPGEYKIYIEEDQLKKLKARAIPNNFSENIYSINSDEEYKEFDFILE